jgi:hypothetical protein
MKRHPLVSLLMAIVGALMLLPGVCVVVVIRVLGWPTSSGLVGADFWYFFVWPVCFAISALGVYFIVKAFR